jgi:hypothetical protein
VIASADLLPAMKRRNATDEVLAFSDAEANLALEEILRRLPHAVELERHFAATPRGAALINRIKADPKLASCEIRIIAHDSEYARVPGARPDSETDGAAGAVAVAAPAPVSAPLDQTGTRRAPRFPIVDGVEVMVDGNTATLINLSLVGAQVVSPTILKPNQRLRIALVEGRRPIRISAGVAWASFELAKTGPQYRAGIEFFDAEPDAVEKFCDDKKKQS